MPTFHVSLSGHDHNSGSAAAPLRTIQAAADLAQPGDTVLIRAGIYRERIDPPRGGVSAARRITYQAAPDEMVVVTGADVVEGWELDAQSIWTTSVANSRFADFNPYNDLIRGDWFKDYGRKHHTGAVYIDGDWLVEATSRETLADRQWYAEVGPTVTTFWINPGSADPSCAHIEINVRPTVFYPSQPGINYLSVCGLTLRQAATNWAPPTAEQVGVIGTHWSKGWIIENNVISHSRCTGITLGKHGDAFDNTSADTATGYLATIERAVACGWHRDRIGGHLVRGNHISHCEQAGIVGSLGAIFSEISGNHIHDIHVQRLFGGEEQAGIKLHAPIDTLIADNYIHDTIRAIWLDWMSQGARVTGNLCHASAEEDIFLEVNHGPLVVDHNLLLSPVSLKNWSEGTALIYNLLAGEIRSTAEPNRETPWMRPHDTHIAGLAAICGGDDYFINNWLTDPEGLEKSCASSRDTLTGEWRIDPVTREFPVHTHASQTLPSTQAGNMIIAPPHLEIRPSGLILHLDLSADAGVEIDSQALGSARVSGQAFLAQSDGSACLDHDFKGQPRAVGHFVSGPFAQAIAGRQAICLRINKNQPLAAPVRGCLNF